MYSVKGSIKNFETVELTIEDIFPMDKGTTASTGYELGDEFIDYRMENPKSLSWKVGMIHSHHSMNSYFSGTDMSELSDNTEFHNYYLSLVVNNMGKMVAKVAFRGDIKGYQCKDESGKDWTLKLTADRQAMFTFDCKIITVQEVVKVSKSFAKRTTMIITDSDKKSYIYKKALEDERNAKTKYLPKPWRKENNLPESLKNHKWFQEEREDDWEELDNWNASFSGNKPKSKRDMSQDERYWDFTKYLVRIGDELDSPDTLENALEDSSIIVENVTLYVRKMVTMYPALFEKYWDIFGEINTEVFVTTTGEVLDILENYEGLFEVVEPLINGLELMIAKMQVLDEQGTD